MDRLGFWVVYLRSPLTLASLAMLLVFLWAVWPFFFTPDPPSSRARSGETTPPREMAALPESPGSPCLGDWDWSS